MCNFYVGNDLYLKLNSKVRNILLNYLPVVKICRHFKWFKKNLKLPVVHGLQKKLQGVAMGEKLKFK